MKFDRLARFDADWHRLSEGERALFERIVRTEFHPACKRFAQDRAAAWPRGLRVKRVRGTRGVWEMTWSFSGPDGRATFEWIELDGELAVRWRRIGGHGIFGRP